MVDVIWLAQGPPGWLPVPLRMPQSPCSHSADIDLSAVPEPYHDLREVFSKQQALSLPPHRSYDSAIDLRPGAPLPASRLYNLSRPEREAKERYISKLLASD